MDVSLGEDQTARMLLHKQKEKESIAIEGEEKPLDDDVLKLKQRIADNLI